MYRKFWFEFLKEEFIFLLNFDQNYFVQLWWNLCSTCIPKTTLFDVKHSQAMLKRGVCELAHFFFHDLIALSKNVDILKDFIP